jgi:SPFH domain / Band 7 family
MFNIGYYKAQPTEWVRQFVGGRLAREGPALSFYYLKHRTSVVVVPTSSTDAGFVFNELTGNFQAVTIQGQCTYRIADPPRAAELLNFAIDPARRGHLSDDPQRLQGRVINVIQMETRRQVQNLTLEETLRGVAGVAATVREQVGGGALLAPLGVELLSIYFTSASPRPEVGKALEAEYREALLRRADEAIYARRAATVAEEGKIKANELGNEIALEEERARLIALEGANARQEAEFRGQALELEAGYRARATEAELTPLRALEPRQVLALAMRDLGQGAGRIGHLNITSELLASLLGA